METAGDCYIVAGGLMRKDKDGSTSVLMVVEPLNALHVFQFAKVTYVLISLYVHVTGNNCGCRVVEVVFRFG